MVEFVVVSEDALMNETLLGGGLVALFVGFLWTGLRGDARRDGDCRTCMAGSGGGRRAEGGRHRRWRHTESFEYLFNPFL
uniref:Uncharacterized protein n=1 Tax=Rhizophora mucronata TaxID=61149 RepID=A0A2P2Q1T4_RHIMU